MKNVLYIVLSFLLLTGCEKEVSYLQDRDGVKYEPNKEVGFTGVLVEKWDNGQKKLEEHYKNGELVGFSKSWLENGQKVVSLEPRDGVMYEAHTEEPFTGVYVERFHYNGRKKWEGNYKDGKKNGLSTSYWWEKGQKLSEGNYKNDKKDGLWVSWWEKGQKGEEGNYKDGKKDGLWTYWNEDGRKWGEGNWKDGKKEGRWTFWDKDGNINRTETYKNGELVK